MGRGNGFSINHPNDWILTIGGRQASDQMADMIELFEPQTGVSIDTGLRISRKNMYRAMLDYDMNTKVLFMWGGLYDPANEKLKVYDDLMYIVLSKGDAIEPTGSPTAAPSESPTEVPTDAPSESPTVSPTLEPSMNPTFEPTPSPSNQFGEGEANLIQTSQSDKNVQNDE